MASLAPKRPHIFAFWPSPRYLADMTSLPIDLDAFNAAPLTRQPFDFALVPRFVKPDAMTAINAETIPWSATPAAFPCQPSNTVPLSPP